MAPPVQVDSPGRSWAEERVLVRADLNAPLEAGPGGRPRVADDARIRASVATLRYLLDQGAAVAVCSHLGRPKGQRVDDLSLAPCAERLSELLGQPAVRHQYQSDHRVPGPRIRSSHVLQPCIAPSVVGCSPRPGAAGRSR